MAVAAAVVAADEEAHSQRVRFTAAQVQAAIDSGRLAEALRPAANAQVTEEVDTLNGGVAGYTEPSVASAE